MSEHTCPQVKNSSGEEGEGVGGFGGWKVRRMAENLKKLSSEDGSFKVIFRASKSHGQRRICQLAFFLTDHARL